jgi:hypothetical protein
MSALFGAGDGHLCQSREAERLCRCRSHVDDSTAHEWTAIVDGHHHRLPIALVRNLHFGAYGQASMSGGEISGIQSLPARGPAAAFMRVDRCKTSLVRCEYAREMDGKKLTGQDRSREQHHPTFHRVALLLCCAQRRRVGRCMRPTRLDFRMGQLVSECCPIPRDPRL